MDDHSFVAGLGYRLGLETDDNPLDLAGPQATSTVASKMTRDQVNRQYLQKLEASEGSSEEFCSLRSASRASNQYHLLSSSDKQRTSSGVGMMMALPLINTDSMSGLSSSKFLVDHTQLNNELLEGSASREQLVGLPPALLEPQEVLLDEEQQDVTEEGTRNVSLLTDHLAETKLGEKEFSSMQSDGSHQESIIKGGVKRPLEMSKLLSNSCNSLGSLEGQPDPFLSHQQRVGGFDEDWLETDQHELVNAMEDEEFQAPDMTFFEEEERKHHQEKRFLIDPAPPSSKASLDLTCFSGIHGVSEITVRPSWIESPEKELLGPNNHMLVDDYLQARSEALGTLGTNKDPSSRPNFGKEVHSPPTASTRILPLVDMSVDDDSRESGSSVSNLEHEETIRTEVIHAVEELEASMPALGQPVKGATIGSLLSRALSTSQPHELVERILRLTKDSQASPAFLDSTGLDASVEVAELRKLKEEVVGQKQGLTTLPVRKDKGVGVPQHLALAKVCVAGVAAYTTLPIHNPFSRWLQVTLTCLKETIDGSPSMTSALLFETSHILEPQSQREVKLGVCSPLQGKLNALIKVQVEELAAAEMNSAFTSTHTVQVSAAIVAPEVEVQCEGGGGSLNFGVIGESCCVSQAITLTSYCPQPLPLLLHLQQMATRAPIFYWEEEKNKGGKVVSASHLSCELSPSTPTTFYVTLRAPYLNGTSVNQNEKLLLESYLRIMLDAPPPIQVTLTSCPIKAVIGLIKLEILRTKEPLRMETTPHQIGTTELTLKNASSFPLRISLSLNDHCQAFSINPPKLTMSPGTQTSLTLSFTPGASSVTLNSMLVLRVEPNGMEFEIAVCGVCFTPPQPPPSLPLSVLAPASTLTSPPASVKTPPVHPAHKQIENIHKQVVKANSAPLPQIPAPGLCLSEKALSAALESTKSHLVFGTVAVGATSCQKITLRNTLTNQKLPLSITIVGSDAFQVCENGIEAGQEKLNVVLNPSQELVLSVLLRPCSVESVTATLLCRHHSSSNPFKWKIPLQGYGGRGEIVMSEGNAGKPILIKDLAPGLPVIFQTTVTNVGHRTLFIALQVFSDKQHKEPASDLSVQPTRVVLSPGKNHEIYVVANGTLKQLARTPGIIGVLCIISGEEILRKRYKRMKNKEVKARRITNPDLLKLNWIEEFTGEQEAKNEPDLLPPQPEDAVVFFNSCTTTQVEVWGEQRPNDDQSTSVFACLAGEETVADFAFTQERVGSSIPTSTHADPILSQTSPSTSWDVLPQTLNIRADDNSPHVFFVVNFTSTQQMIEVSCDSKWLEIKPREAVIAGHSSVKLCVTTHLPRIPTSPVTYSLKVMGETESRSATITILPVTEKEAQTNHLPPIPAPETIKSSRSMPSQTTNHSHSISTTVNSHMPNSKAKSIQQLSTTTSSQSSAAAKPSSPTSLQPSSTTTTATNNHVQGTAPTSAKPVLSSGSKDQRKTTQKCQVQVMSENLNFQDTKVFQETYAKIMLRNLDKIDHLVQADVKNGPFTMRHREFTIKSGHYVNVPVYFRPLKSGLSTGHLQLTVLKDKMVLPVTLSGQALT